MPNPLRALAVLSFSMLRRCSNFPFFSLVAMVVLLGACSNRQVKVEMQAGTEGPERIFETNRADRDEIGRLSETYEAAPSTRAGGKDGVRFEGVFAERDLPSEFNHRPSQEGPAEAFVTPRGRAMRDGAWREQR